jgi:hypothetical protein
LGGFGDISKIKYLTFSDFAWNNKDYNPDFSLFKALVRYVGRDNGRLLLQFNAVYYQFVSLWGKVRMEKAHDPAYQCTAEENRLAGMAINRMTAAFDSLKHMDSRELVGQLEGVMKTKIDAWNALVRKTAIK